MENLNNPYVSPESSPQAPDNPLSGALSKYGPYRDTRPVAKVLKVMLVVCCISFVLFGGVNYSYYSALKTFDLESSMSRITSIEETMLAAGVLMLIAYLVTAITFAIWTVKSMKNAWASSGSVGLIRPGWSVGWYFVPIATLWKPVEAVGQMRDAAFGRKQGLSLVPWWSFWLLSTVTGRISSKMPLETVEEIQTSALFDLATTPIDVLSAVFAYLVVDKLTKKQHEVATGNSNESI